MPYRLLDSLLWGNMSLLGLDQLCQVVMLHIFQSSFSERLFIKCGESLAMIHVTIENGANLRSLLVHKDPRIASLGKEEVHFFQSLPG